MTINNEIFYPAFFGYENLPNSIEVKGCKLIPVKSLCLKYHGTITNSSQSNSQFCVGNIRSLCNSLEIHLHRPVRGLYCIEERYQKFFNTLYQFYIKEVSSYDIHYSNHYYNYKGDLMWCMYNRRTGEILHEKKCDGRVIKNIFYGVMV